MSVYGFAVSGNKGYLLPEARNLLLAVLVAGLLLQTQSDACRHHHNEDGNLEHTSKTSLIKSAWRCVPDAETPSEGGEAEADHAAFKTAVESEGTLQHRRLERAAPQRSRQQNGAEYHGDSQMSFPDGLENVGKFVRRGHFE